MGFMGLVPTQVKDSLDYALGLRPCPHLGVAQFFCMAFTAQMLVWTVSALAIPEWFDKLLRGSCHCAGFLYVIPLVLPNSNL